VSQASSSIPTANADAPGQAAAATDVPLRRLAPAWLALVLLAALAWVLTVAQARGMEAGPGTMGLGLPLFVVMWVAMMTAMMFPSVAPVAIMWTKVIRGRSGGWSRAGRQSSFLAGYLISWTGYGLVAYGALLGTERLVQMSPGGAMWLGVGIFSVAGLYQLTPLKDACLRHCRSPLSTLFHYASFIGPWRDLRVGVHHGLYCVGCCWGLMLVLVAVGVMNVAAMAALAAVIFLEKLWRRGVGLTRLVGVAFLAIALLVPFYPSLLPGLRAASMAGM
jgi:predicted metal-binding membrane protein